MQSAKRTRLDTASYRLYQHQQTEGISKKNSIFSPTRYSPGEGPLRDNVDISHSVDGSHVHLQIIHGATQFQNTTTAVQAVDEDWTLGEPDVGMHAVPGKPNLGSPVDLATRVNGLYRILDLTSETGSGGLVDKIVIDQPSLGRFINHVLPGAYVSLVEVDFKALDNIQVRPLGVYGSQSQIVEFMLSLNAVDSETADALRASGHSPAHPTTLHLRSGLYILRHENAEAERDMLYVIFWPQATTWNDDAESAVRQNRVTFMRYLTQICHQTMALVAPEHARRIVWGLEDEQDQESDDDDDSDRMGVYEVAKTKEQDEGVDSKAGFVYHYGPDQPTHRTASSVDPSWLRSFLVYGNCAVGFVTVSYTAPFKHTRTLSEAKQGIQLDDYISKGSFRLSPSISTEALSILLEHGLEKRAVFQYQIFLANQAAALHDVAQVRSEAVRSAQKAFLASTTDAFINDPCRVDVIENVKKSRVANWQHPGFRSPYSFGGQSFIITGSRRTQKPASRAHKLHVFQLTEGDKQHLQFDPSHVPMPQVHHGSATHFDLPVTSKILLMRLLPADHCLLILEDGEGSVVIYLEQTQSLGPAVLREGAYKKLLRKDKLPGDRHFAYDERKRMLVVSIKYQLHMFVFDERYTTLLGFGSMIDLAPWYDALTMITHVAFAGSAGEELLLVDDHQNARVLSLITQRFRPTFVSLPEPPSSILASPDGSCFFSVTNSEGRSILRAYHWSNFGATNGIVVDLADLPTSNCAITSFLNTSIHFVALVPDEEQIRSVLLTITRKVTEFSFQEKRSGQSSRRPVDTNTTVHNSLLNCHADVWNKFPVVPAIRRRVITASTGVQPKAFLFVTEQDCPAFLPYWKNLITQFERRTRKPTENELSGIHAQALSQEELSARIPGTVSTLRAGEWLVNLLCLIPIHIAIARDNRFIPLKDGVFSASMERSLLGAQVETIVDNISFGWYESIFRSYMSNKPVKVVSSMGEQSVGKSFALNHFVDASFAGSAMRTTEGVWMSVTPTEDALIVAMDFEGVHSIERSAQEDTLLVLFNTAISNMVLFRNNFALSRDITGLFQSFQSSSTFLDPASNPGLFRSILTIIIKDVVDSDKKEIRKEFSLKFQQIVQREQEANFISRLHRGRINIVPWPVIESKQFYTLFNKLKNSLDEEPVTHHHASFFLHTLKTLMAKLKTSDWGSMSQNLAVHRARILASILPSAVAYGVAEVEPIREPLRNYDDQSILDAGDTNAVFYLRQQLEEDEPDSSGDAGSNPKVILRQLQTSWPRYTQRLESSEDEWMAGLSQHLDNLVQQRMSVVQSWIAVNTSRFPDADASIGPLQRKFDQMAGDVKASVQMCSLKCTGQCYLRCLLARNHDGAHDCSTNHRCTRSCQYNESHPDDVLCGMPAGHPGSHICDVAKHLCGEQCKLYGKEGCMRRCVKMAGHEGADDHGHVCQASVHECGEPCGLRDAVLANGSHYVCQEKCRKPSHEVHDKHACSTMSCPIDCQLCTTRQRCSNRDHMHGLAAGAVHLCGQEHRCKSLCAAKGVCHIETQPQSIEASFTGHHERFQYTKYSQIHSRLPCKVPIPPSELEHSGVHVHDTGPVPFHYCTTTCENCGYYCKLPYSHPQSEHDTVTSHGSMSKTRWAIDGDEAVIQVQGRKFGANDDGAPMLCNMVCKDMGRHAHVDFCHSDDPETCAAAGLEHSTTRMLPEPDRPKDWISHKLYWQRTGFKDPYSVDDQRFFEKCDALCAGPEHQSDAQNNPQPSHCTLPLFHPPHTSPVAPGAGYVSDDGHVFSCRKPAVMLNAFHVIFVVDRSISMSMDDHRPLQGTPTTAKITAACDDRLGAVYSALYAFWATGAALRGQGGARRDAYSVVLFDYEATSILENDLQSSPDQLLDIMLQHRTQGATDYDEALAVARGVMERCWSTDRSPVVIFLSDGECEVADASVQDMCNSALMRGYNLSLHAVAFGPSIDTLQHMVRLATKIQDGAPVDPTKPLIPSSYTAAIDSIHLAETYLGIAASLRRPRGSLLRG